MPRLPRAQPSADLVKKDAYSTLEAAELLGVSFQTVARWMDRGYLTGWRTPGGHRIIHASSLEEMLRRGQTTSADARMAPGAGLRILAVDDSADDLTLVRAALRSAFPDADLTTVDNAFAALMSIGKSPPDVLITDAVMPDVDGLEMIRNLRASPQTQAIQVIIISNHPEVALIKRFGPLPEGVMLVSKPVTPEALRKVIGQPPAAARA
jgi:excisionase family DNA binding protein